MTKISHQTVGQHFIIDFWGAENLIETDFIESTLTIAAKKANATLLNIKMHSFPGGGVTGVALLAESHISIHTWPEHQYAALDVFLCGECQAEQSIEYLEQAFMPKKKHVQKIDRGSF